MHVQVDHSSLGRRTTLALNHQPGEKLPALLVRGNPRDLSDIWLLLRQGVEPDLTLVERKLALHDREWKREALDEAIQNLRAEGELGLRRPLSQLLTCTVVQGDVNILQEQLPQDGGYLDVTCRADSRRPR